MYWILNEGFFLFESCWIRNGRGLEVCFLYEGMVLFGLFFVCFVVVDLEGIFVILVMIDRVLVILCGWKVVERWGWF